MHILLEEAPLLVFYFLTLFLSNYKLRLILSIFWTKSTFCQLPLTCSLTSFVRYARLALPSLRCGRFAAHLLTHFIRSLAMCFEIVHKKFHELVLSPTILYFASLYTISQAEVVCRIATLMSTHFFQIRLFNLLYHHFTKFVCAIDLFRKIFHKIVKCAGTPMSYTTITQSFLCKQKITQTFSELKRFYPQPPTLLLPPRKRKITLLAFCNPKT